MLPLAGRAQRHTEEGGERLGGIEELAGVDGVVIGGVNGDVDEGLLDGVEEGHGGGWRAIERIGQCVMESE